jgi:hypothetical protein
MLHLVHTSDQFSRLTSTTWDNLDERKAISRKAISLDEYSGDSATLSAIDVEDHEAAWSILQAVSMDPTYVKFTAYNLFTLLALGNKFSNEEPVSNSMKMVNSMTYAPKYKVQRLQPLLPLIIAYSEMHNVTIPR